MINTTYPRTTIIAHEQCHIFNKCRDEKLFVCLKSSDIFMCLKISDPSQVMHRESMLSIAMEWSLKTLFMTMSMSFLRDWRRIEGYLKKQSFDY